MIDADVRLRLLAEQARSAAEAAAAARARDHLAQLLRVPEGVLGGSTQPP
jgi:hypothetical protein